MILQRILSHYFFYAHEHNLIMCEWIKPALLSYLILLSTLHARIMVYHIYDRCIRRLFFSFRWCIFCFLWDIKWFKNIDFNQLLLLLCYRCRAMSFFASTKCLCSFRLMYTSTHKHILCTQLFFLFSFDICLFFF